MVLFAGEDVTEDLVITVFPGGNVHISFVFFNLAA